MMNNIQHEDIIKKEIALRGLIKIAELIIHHCFRSCSNSMLLFAKGILTIIAKYSQSTHFIHIASLHSFIHQWFYSPIHLSIHPGYYCTEGSNTSNPSIVSSMGGPCPTGSFCIEGSSQPQNCYPGTYASIEQQSNCTVCPPGYHCVSGSSVITPCPKGKCSRAINKSSIWPKSWILRYLNYLSCEWFIYPIRKSLSPLHLV